ncbi:MAG TPA: DUF3253 domain-containing protein [Nevskiaceae bacterium]|nr:DUF3253 domain-containing protein [Nevskiaceae bacterium]
MTADGLPPTPADPVLRSALLDACRLRGVNRSICPSEVARALAEDWRGLMPAVRRAAAELIAEGRIEATQGGQPVDLRSARGPIRLRLRRSAPDSP